MEATHVHNSCMRKDLGCGGSSERWSHNCLLVCAPLRCSTCSGRGSKTCTTCKGEKKLLHFIQLVIMWYVAGSRGAWPSLVSAEKLSWAGAFSVQGPAGRKVLRATWKGERCLGRGSAGWQNAGRLWNRPVFIFRHQHFLA